jgi:amino acid transporter
LTALYADAVRPISGPAASAGIAGLAVLFCLGALVGWIFLQGQVPLAAAQHRLFPCIWQSKQGIPLMGLIISSILISVLLLLKLHQDPVAQFTFIIALATLVALLPYFFMTMATLMLFIRNPKLLTRGQGLSHAVFMTVLGGLYAFWVRAHYLRSNWLDTNIITQLMKLGNCLGIWNIWENPVRIFLFLHGDGKEWWLLKGVKGHGPDPMGGKKCKASWTLCLPPYFHSL